MKEIQSEIFGKNPWDLLSVFSIYRLIIASLMLGVALIGIGSLGQNYPTLFLRASIAYECSAIIFILATLFKFGDFNNQVWLQLGTDIVVISLFTYASGGISSGLGVLLIVIVAAGGILTLGRHSSGLAALAVLALLFEHSYGFLSENSFQGTYTQAGLLGIALFSTALLSQVLAQHIRMSQVLASSKYIPSKSEIHQAWGPLTVFCIYRLMLATLLVGIAFTGTHPNLLGDHKPYLFSIVSATYCVLSVIFISITLIKIGKFNTQIWLQLSIDIGIIVLLMHTSGGINSGLGMLLIVTVAAGGIMTLSTTASGLAALAVLSLLLEHSYAYFLEDDIDIGSYTQVGLLGISLFTTALLAQVLTTRVRSSELLAVRKGQDLEELKQLKDYIFQHLQDGALVVGDNGNIQLINQKGQDFLGFTQNNQNVLNIQTIPALAQAMQDWQNCSDYYHPKALHIAPDLPELQPQFIRLIGTESTLIFLENYSYLRQQAQQLKLASLGRLTASIAHEIRNPLGAISHASQLLEETLELDKGNQRLLDIILTNSNRINEIVKNVLQLSRKDSGVVEQIALKPWLTRFLEEFYVSKKTDETHVSLEIESNSIYIEANPSQLHQIIWNLCDNAWHYGRKIDQPPYLKIVVCVKTGPYPIMVEVIDSGPGISKEIIDHLFEPFTSTKGTGLGLYLARALAENNGAILEYCPNPPKSGTCFHICFPAPKLENQ
ncbi:two-component system sensor histidine kinase NtrB [Candidatus Nitrosacidococcus tergens]|uniref:histidine kinase n=1 Tax=Candidatus Nitrosacidococcus tergens TaxID=553981 RepID=A0A7G1QBY1_9GAMM|nr:HAMP domain-containing sensor histidine kinase [Candidatus Nitrosacidococcus tergens]CAB1277039.1 ATP-binding region ATPase domain protein (modular protein) [Candidatus Nitrosacidococcus tergens]